MIPPGPFSLSPGHAFTVWLDPSRWPKPPLRLPGAAFTVWLKPERWPAVPLRLPGRGHTLWLDPQRWPLPALRLPGTGFTLWQDPAVWPPLPPTAALEPSAAARTAEALPPPEPLLPQTPPPDFSPASMPISLPPNKAFTLWTRPAQVVPIPMKNGLTAAQLAGTVTPAPLPSGPAPSAQLSVGPKAPAPSMTERWLPLAAALVAVAGLHALISAGEARKAAVNESEVHQMRGQIGEVSKGMDGMRDRMAADNAAFAEKTAQWEATAKAMKEQKDLLVTDLAKAMEDNRKAGARLTEQEGVIQQLTQDLTKARLEAATAGTQAESKIVEANEAASKIRRETGAALVGLTETLARVEAEKAAALKAAAEAAASLAALQAKVASPAPAPPKPAP